MTFLLPVHILGGSLAIVAGAIALAVAKGRTLHRRSGIVFVVAMLTMGTAGAIMALRHGADPNVLGGLMSVYLVTTAWTTVRQPSVGARPLAIAGLLLSSAVGAVTLVLGIVTVVSGPIHGVPWMGFVLFAAVGLIGAAGDLRLLRAGLPRGAAMLRRHIWRMCTALFIATVSFFSIRSRVARILPEPFLGGGMRALPILLVIAAMVYWLWRVRRRQPAIAAFTPPAAARI